MGASAPIFVSERRKKDFFFEKKKQKTFDDKLHSSYE